LFLPNVTGAMFIQGVTFIPDSRVGFDSGDKFGNYLSISIRKYFLTLNMRLVSFFKAFFMTAKTKFAIKNFK
jgi:hypothetical protein